MLLFFATSGDVAYLDGLIEDSGLVSTPSPSDRYTYGELTTYFVLRLTCR